MTAQTITAARELIDFIDASPSPWHVVASAETLLLAQGFARIEEDEPWKLAAGGRYYAVRGASLIAFVLGSQALVETGFRIIGAHTDSPGLRLKPKAAIKGDGLAHLGVEVYGGPILATFTDRDLSLAGRIVFRTATGADTLLLRFKQPLLRLPNLAIHMNREVNEQGLRLNKQTELPLILGQLGDDEDAEANLRQLLADAAQRETADLLSWELAVYDVQQGCLWGANEEFIADSQLDNLGSTHAALTALLATQKPAATCVAAFFDHEEVGSESASGAGGSFLADVNQRYTSNAETAARFMGFCEKAGVPCQQYAHRSDLGCGSTIGPILAAQLGIASVDVGSPMWAMHSARESAGVLDHAYMIAALKAAFGSLTPAKCPSEWRAECAVGKCL